MCRPMKVQHERDGGLFLAKNYGCNFLVNYIRWQFVISTSGLSHQWALRQFCCNSRNPVQMPRYLTNNRRQLLLSLFYTFQRRFVWHMSPSPSVWPDWTWWTFQLCSTVSWSWPSMYKLFIMDKGCEWERRPHHCVARLSTVKRSSHEIQPKDWPIDPCTFNFHTTTVLHVIPSLIPSWINLVNHTIYHVVFHHEIWSLQPAEISPREEV